MPAQTPTSTADQRKWWLIGGVGVAAGVAVAIWFGVSASTGRPVWTDVGYRVEGNQAVTVRYDLTREVGREVRCTVKALDVHHAAVGSVTVKIPAAQEKTTREVTQVRTTHRAVTGLVDTCVYAEDATSSP